MDIGLSLGGASLSFRDQVNLAVEAEANGFDLVAVGDSGGETFALHGALAMATHRVRLVSSIAIWTRSPATMANGATTVHSLSAGRFTLGVGPAPRQWIEEQHGQEFTPVVPRFRDYLRAVRACLDASSANPSDVDSPYYPTHGFTNRDVELPSPVRLIMGATQPRMLRMSGEECDGVMVNVMSPLPWITGECRDLIEAGRAASGRDGEPFGVGVGRFVGIDEDREAAYDVCRWQLAWYYRVPYFRGLLEGLGYADEVAVGEAAFHTGDIAAACASISDEMVDAIALAGTPDEVRAKLHDYEGVLDWVSLSGKVDGDPERSGRTMRHIVELLRPRVTTIV